MQCCAFSLSLSSSALLRVLSIISMPSLPLSPVYILGHLADALTPKRLTNGHTPTTMSPLPPRKATTANRSGGAVRVRGLSLGQGHLASQQGRAGD